MSYEWLYITTAITLAFCVIVVVLWIKLRRHSQSWTIVSLVVSMLFGVAGVAQLAVAIAPAELANHASLENSPLSSPTSAHVSPQAVETSAACSATGAAPGFAKAKPESASGLFFCPTQINNGQLPFRGPFILAGQVIGSEATRQQLVAFVRVDPATCDTLGKHGSSGRFLLSHDQLNFLSDGTWSYYDNFGDYAPGVTFGRMYEFGIAPKDVVQSLLNSRSEWAQNGIVDLPGNVEILATFTVGPGAAATKAACK